jgi:hypothetical protein
MTRNLNMMSAFMVIMSLWNLLGFVQGLIQVEGQFATIPVAVQTALVIIFLPLSRGGRKWTIAASAALGVIAVILAVGGMITSGDFLGTGGFLILGVLTALFGFMAYREPSKASTA